MSTQHENFPIPENAQRQIDATRAAREAEHDRLEDMGIYSGVQINEKLREQFGDLDISPDQIEVEEAEKLRQARVEKTAARIGELTTGKKTSRKPRPLGPMQLDIADGDKRVETVYGKSE